MRLKHLSLGNSETAYFNTISSYAHLSADSGSAQANGAWRHLLEETRTQDHPDLAKEDSVDENTAVSAGAVEEGKFLHKFQF